jgi:DNA invertase Pin-like site-specific DNA recombinase
MNTNSTQTPYKINGQNIGYVRVSTVDQNTSRQLDGISLDKVFTDRLSGKDINRPQLQAALSHLRDGDVLHIHSFDRLARNLNDLNRMVTDLVNRGVTIKFYMENLTFEPKAGGGLSPYHELLMQLLGAVAQFERANLLERQREGIVKAKQAGKYKGRKPIAQKPEQLAAIKQALASSKNKSAIAKQLNISRATLYKYMGQMIEQTNTDI